MKKNILFFALLMVGNMGLSAETMKFVTLLTQPIGTFSSVEVADTTKPATMGKLEFCNSGIAGGTIDVTSVEIGNSLTTQGPSTLLKTNGGGTVTASILTMKPVTTNATFLGGKLDARQASISEIEVGENLQLNPSITTTKTASFASMTVTNIAKYDGDGNNNYVTSWQQANESGCKSAGNGTDAACRAKLVYYKKSGSTP